MDDEFVAALEDQDDGLEQSSSGVEAEAEFAVRPVVGVVQRLDPLRPSRPPEWRPRRRSRVCGHWGGPSCSRCELRQCPSDHLRARHPLAGGDGVEGCDLVGAQTHRDHLHGLRAAPWASPAAAPEGLDVVAGLRLVNPCPDLGLADLVLTHRNIVNENRAVREDAVEDAVRRARRFSWRQVWYSSAMRIMVLESAQMTASLVLKW